MSKQKRSIPLLAMFITFTVIVVFLADLTRAGNLEPSGPPGSTMKTLDEIPPTWSQTLSASDRFELVLNNEAVLDKETGLVWAKDAYNYKKEWMDAVIYCIDLTIGNRKGWRLPTVQELASLVDPDQSSPALPVGHPFNNVQSDLYWSSTTCDALTDNAWYVSMYKGGASYIHKTYQYYIWPVRGDND